MRPNIDEEPDSPVRNSMIGREQVWGYKAQDGGLGPLCFSYRKWRRSLNQQLSPCDPHTVAAALPGKLSEMQHLRSHPRPAE